MVKSIRVGGVIFESTPFSKEPQPSGEEDLRVHVYAVIPMAEAMGPNMTYVRTADKRVKMWKKNGGE